MSMTAACRGSWPHWRKAFELRAKTKARRKVAYRLLSRSKDPHPSRHVGTPSPQRERATVCDFCRVRGCERKREDFCSEQIGVKELWLTYSRKLKLKSREPRPRRPSRMWVSSERSAMACVRLKALPRRCSTRCSTSATASPGWRWTSTRLKLE